jgi:hypothetical protein
MIDTTAVAAAHPWIHDALGKAWKILSGNYEIIGVPAAAVGGLYWLVEKVVHVHPGTKKHDVTIDVIYKFLEAVLRAMKGRAMNRSVKPPSASTWEPPKED